MKAVDRKQDEERLVDTDDDDVEAAHGARLLHNLRGVSLILLSGSLAMLPWAFQTAGMRGALLGYAIAAAAWMLLLWTRWSAGAWTALVLALVLRLPLAFVQPALSTDAFRYLWDGKVLASRVDPYRYAPDEPQLSSMRERWHSRINHPEIATIYPPHAELLFAIASISGGMVAWKLLVLACELSTVALLAAVSRRAAVAYATMPLAIVECAWSGHVEAVAALALFAAVLLRARRRATSGALAALAVGAKLTPIAAVPAFLALLDARSRLRWLVAFVLTLLLPVLPFALAGPLMPGMREYATRWVFNAPLFSLAFAAIDGCAVPALLKSGWTAVKSPLYLELLSPFVYTHLYADWLARAVCGVIAVSAIAHAVRRARTLAGGSCDAVGVLLLCSPAVHPWYWIALLPLALVARRRGWIAAALCAPFSYLSYAGVAPVVVFAVCYGLPLIAMWRRRSHGSGSFVAAGRG